MKHLALLYLLAVSCGGKVYTEAPEHKFVPSAVEWPTDRAELKAGEVMDCDGGNAPAMVLLTGTGATVRNCILHNVRVQGPAGMNGEAEGVRLSSATTGHTERMQAQAPVGVRIEWNKFETDSGIPIYLSPGVTYATIQGNTISGHSASVAIYLDAESGHNTITGNVIDFTSDRRELIAVDGSAHNLIANNQLLNPWHGGVSLYRNCGEGGTARHQTPSYNIIRGTWPVLENSRNGNRSYCGDDAYIGLPDTSSTDDGDNGHDNTIEAP